MSPRKKVSVKRTHLKQDKLVNTIFLLTKWVKEKQSIVIGGIAGLVVVIVLVSLTASARRKSADRANELWGKAEVMYSAKAYDKAIPMLTDLIENYGRKPQSKLALFYMANALYDQGNYDEAEGYYERFVREVKEDDLLIPSAIAGIGACWEEKGNYLEAGEKYLEAAKENPEYYLVPQYLLDAGRCFLQANALQRARETYEELVTTYPQTEYSDKAELALGELLKD